MANNVPVATPDFEHEPALTLGEIFANKSMIKTYVAAVLTIVATGARFAVDDQLIDAIATVVQLLGIIATPFIAQLENGERAQQQAAATREAVYSPASFEEAAFSVPPKEWGVNRGEDDLE